MRILITRAITGAIFVAIVVGSFFAPVAVFQIIFLAFALLAVREYLHIASEDAHPQSFMPFLLTTLLYSAFHLLVYSVSLSLLLFLICLLFALCIPIIELYRKKDKPLSNISVSLFPLLWIALPFGIIGMWTYFLEAGSTVLALFILIWLNDTLAYCAGSLFGKHKLFERISPKKSWEGFIAALVLTSAASAAFHYIPFFRSPVLSNVGLWIGFSIVVIVFSTFGDLTESLFKRSSNIKDSGHILPGHGGILDRFDSFLFAAPAGFIYWFAIYYFS